ncbi:hypothetical protein KGG85_gp60 [Streptomyces phage Tefunt]|uniref:Uncharacterized protein n=1 Tax=Streptomyces phage Tefunt TaxID=2041209 RepID=A0A291LHY1_9CAUD|nr:hypothetical protein KGG85_gp60 [Streptomyces phage Tefunt]ATI19000.1 hypothetical protein SEA_TEFUNT_60 [Streptomyces phage Tefunt]AXH70264.1 hypothetical protein SEA_HAIZUM_60 [Streptomyces phage Haizum]QAY15802.1 hypothetical protein SEA_NISHIKIGOI_61 [Streptomyces phage Nishikigoi]
MSTTADALKNLERVIRQQVSKEQSEQVSEDRITLLVIRQRVAEYQLAETERQGHLDQLVEDGEYEGTYAYDSQLSENETAAAGNLSSLLAELATLLP